MLFYQNDNFVYTQDKNYIAYYALLAELKLFTHENDLDIDAGVDYKSVLNSEKFLKTELDRVCQKYSDRLTSYEISEPALNGDVLSCEIAITLKNGETKNTTITI